MDRRNFIGSVALGLLAVPLARPPFALAQSARKAYRIGILSIGSASSWIGPQPRSPSAKAFLAAMRELGYVHGEHFVTEVRGADGRPERFPALAAELVRLQVDLIVAGGGPTLPALKQATSTIPIVMAATGDPVAEGYVQSLAHPGGNITGLSLQSSEAVGKRLELLKNLAPGVAPVAVLWNGASILNWQAAETTARQRGWKVLSLELRSADEIEEVFKTASNARTGGLLVFAAGVLFPQAARVADLAAKYRLPAAYELRQFVDAGGLFSYGPDIVDIWRRASVFVVKILKGAKPGDLPVEQPTKFELVINLKAAKALGLTVPQSLLLRADEVIQ